jgi:hypothetical protein
MKSLLFVSILTLTLVSCKTTKHAGCDAYSVNSINNSDTLTKLQKIQNSLDEEALIFSTWSQEQRNYFYQNFVFSYEELDQKMGLKLK